MGRIRRLGRTTTRGYWIARYRLSTTTCARDHNAWQDKAEWHPTPKPQNHSSYDPLKWGSAHWDSILYTLPSSISPCQPRWKEKLPALLCSWFGKSKKIDSYSKSSSCRQCAIFHPFGPEPWVYSVKSFSPRAVLKRSLEDAIVFTGLVGMLRAFYGIRRGWINQRSWGDRYGAFICLRNCECGPRNCRTNCRLSDGKFADGGRSKETEEKLESICFRERVYAYCRSLYRLLLFISCGEASKARGACSPKVSKQRKKAVQLLTSEEIDAAHIPRHSHKLLHSNPTALKNKRDRTTSPPTRLESGVGGI